MSTYRLFALATVAVTIGCGNDAGGGQIPADGADGGGPERVVNVEVVQVMPESFEDAIGVTGVVEAERDVTVSAEESGVIRAVLVERGGRVRAGDAIARIDDRVMRAQYEPAVSEATLARETYERQRRLWEEEGIGTEMNFLRAKYGAETAAANARVIEARLARTVVRAPISGVVEQRMVEVGSMVAPGAAVARVLAVAPLPVTAGVPERYAGQVRSGEAATVMFDNLASREFTGRTRFVGAAVTEMNRTFVVEVAVPNPGGVLKPGMVAKVRLAMGETRDALLVPREAVLRTEAGYIVYVVRDQDGRTVAEVTPVITGSGTGNRVVIESGLQPDDRVVVVGQHQVAHGDLVRIVEGSDGES
ncbi:efflux RND transporter periplasmic adaptor subunit [soil metagenome]